jgi:sugar phosphate isomerase/epimerase
VTATSGRGHLAEATGTAHPQQERPVTLFTGQWADLPFEEVCRLAAEWGYDGVEIACWGGHFDVLAAVEDPAYVPAKREVLSRHGLGCWAISTHLDGQAVCDAIIDERHHKMVQPRVWGDGDPEGVRRRAAEEMKTTARAARALGVDTVIGFTGSSIWHYLAMFPPVGDDVIRAGYADFADRWHPILDVFDEVGVRFAHEVHPSEIAYDYWSTKATLEAIGHRPSFGLNFDPSHMVWQGLDYVGFLDDFAELIYHVDCKDTKVRMHNGRNGVLGSHLPWADPRRGWDFISTGRGDTRWEDIFRMLNHIGYVGPISVEWEDAGMDRLDGAPEALAFIRGMNAIKASDAAFDAAFASQG